MHKDQFLYLCILLSHVRSLPLAFCFSIFKFHSATQFKI